jgi:hypothetical protein
MFIDQWRLCKPVMVRRWGREIRGRLNVRNLRGRAVLLPFLAFSGLLYAIGSFTTLMITMSHLFATIVLL